MKLLQKILQHLNGLHFPQEYLCLASGSFEEPLHVYLLKNNYITKDITKLHAFVGYSPLIFALSSLNPDILPTDIEIIFTRHLYSPNELFKGKDAIAALRLKKIKEQQSGAELIQYYEGVRGRHHFVSVFHRGIIQVNNRFFQKRAGNVFLPGNLYKQVQIAYCLPRNISLITSGKNKRYNLFPTDLHGPMSDDLYIISLRLGGKACQQVMDTRRILLSKVENEFYKTAYSLGKNHMQEMKEKQDFPFSDQLSRIFQLPLPSHTISYRELELADHFEHGIHRVMLFKLLSNNASAAEAEGLSHIHNAYASWRQNNGLAGNYLLR